MSDLKRLSKFVALALRHRADDFNLELDEDGFTPIEPLMELIEHRFKGKYTRADLETVVAGDDHGKKRYQITDQRIRALYGHSRVKPIRYQVVEPPDILFHGTYPQALPAIRKQGLQPMKRQYVHLSVHTDRALDVGARRAEQPVLLRIHARKAHLAGTIFHQPDDEHFLAKSISPEFIEFP